jgi:hypothetical protein
MLNDTEWCEKQEYDQIRIVTAMIIMISAIVGLITGNVIKEEWSPRTVGHWVNYREKEIDE